MMEGLNIEYNLDSRGKIYIYIYMKIMMYKIVMFYKFVCHNIMRLIKSQITSIFFLNFLILLVSTGREKIDA